MEKICKKSQVAILSKLNIINVFDNLMTYLKKNIISIHFWASFIFSIAHYLLVFYPKNYIKQKFQVSEQTSHKIIEKRRRDRINSCLSELSQTVPAAFSKQVSDKYYIYANALFLEVDIKKIHLGTSKIVRN